MNGRPPFTLLPLLPSGGPVLQLLRQGQIEPADVAVLWAVLQAIEWRAHRAWAELQDLADATGLPMAQVTEATERLQKAGLLAVGRYGERPAWWYWSINPLVATDGRAEEPAQRRRWTEWQQLLAAGAKPGEAVSNIRPRRWRELAREREQRAAARAARAAAAAAEQPTQVLVAALSPDAPEKKPRGRRRPAAVAGGSPAGGGGGGGGGRRPPASPLAAMPVPARTVDLRPTPAQRAADLEWRRWAEEARQARAAAKAAAAGTAAA